MEFRTNQAVFTTKYVLDDDSAIVYVVDDNEDEWQFFGKEKGITEEDARICSLGEMINIDSSLEKILWIPPGTEAWRADLNSAWTTAVYQR